MMIEFEKPGRGGGLYIVIIKLYEERILRDTLSYNLSRRVLLLSLVIINRYCSTPLFNDLLYLYGRING